MTEVQQQVVQWLAVGERGISSRAMAFWLAFGLKTDDFERGSTHPRDPADFDRCLRLLAVAPTLRESLPLMRQMSPEWSALIDRWDEIEALYLNEVGLHWSKGKGRKAEKTHALMLAVIGSSTDVVPPRASDNTTAARRVSP